MSQHPCRQKPAPRSACLCAPLFVALDSHRHLGLSVSDSVSVCGEPRAEGRENSIGAVSSECECEHTILFLRVCVFLSAPTPNKMFFSCWVLSCFPHRLSQSHVGMRSPCTVSVTDRARDSPYALEMDGTASSNRVLRRVSVYIRSRPS